VPAAVSAKLRSILPRHFNVSPSGRRGLPRDTQGLPSVVHCRVLSTAGGPSDAATSPHDTRCRVLISASLPTDAPGFASLAATLPKNIHCRVFTTQSLPNDVKHCPTLSADSPSLSSPAEIMKKPEEIKARPSFSGFIQFQNDCRLEIAWHCPRGRPSNWSRSSAGLRWRSRNSARCHSRSARTARRARR
jgi:hypothetical protein